ncbi:MAG: hypothetical protein EBW11_11340 [Betaproteobacteria bacterium]|nr:hypothetical protein [Betaproteobacteria bacterium]
MLNPFQNQRIQGLGIAYDPEDFILDNTLVRVDPIAGGNAPTAPVKWKQVGVDADYQRLLFDEECDEFTLIGYFADRTLHQWNNNIPQVNAGYQMTGSEFINLDIATIRTQNPTVVYNSGFDFDAEERVFTAREVEMAQRKKAIDLIDAQQAVERDALQITAAAAAEREASDDRGAAIRAQAEADADAERIRAMAQRVRSEMEAESLRMMNEAHNVLSPEARMSALRLKLVEKAEAIIRESVKPMERIEGIKILHVEGLAGGGGGTGGESGGAGFADSVVNSALRFRAQAPIVDQLLREIGLEGGDIGRLAAAASGGTAALPPAKAPAGS